MASRLLPHFNYKFNPTQLARLGRLMPKRKGYEVAPCGVDTLDFTSGVDKLKLILLKQKGQSG